MARPTQQDLVAALLARHGTTYAREAGIALGRAGPASLWRLLCLSLLLSARISADLAVAAARAQADQGWTTSECGSTERPETARGANAARGRGRRGALTGWGSTERRRSRTYPRRDRRR